MTFATLLPLLLQYAPEAISVIGRVTANVAAGRANAVVTAADWAELDRLGALTAEDIYKRLGITPPPPDTFAKV